MSLRTCWQAFYKPVANTSCWQVVRFLHVYFIDASRSFFIWNTSINDHKVNLTSLFLLAMFHCWFSCITSGDGCIAASAWAMVSVPYLKWRIYVTLQSNSIISKACLMSLKINWYVVVLFLFLQLMARVPLSRRLLWMEILSLNFIHLLV